MKKMKKSFMDELPHEILFDILSSRLSIKSILRLRCASTYLRKMIDGQRFAAMHLTHAYPKEPSEILLFDTVTDPHSIFLHLVRREGDDDEDRRDLKTSLLTKFPDNRYNKYHSCNCNGLLCFVSDSSSAIVLNPIKREILMLSPSPSYSRMLKLVYGLGHDPSTNTYKAFRCYFSLLIYKKEHCTVEIQTLGTSSWREISEKPPCVIYKSPVFAYGALHWKCCNMVLFNNEMKGMLVSFDMAKEVFYLTPHPEFQYFYLVDLGGCLGIVDDSSNMQIEIWLLKECCDNGKEEKKKEWVKEYTIGIKTGDRDFKVIVVGMWGHGEILLEENRGWPNRRIISYNPKTDRLRDIPELKNKNCEIYGYKGSLISLANFM